MPSIVGEMIMTKESNKSEDKEAELVALDEGPEELMPDELQDAPAQSQLLAHLPELETESPSMELLPREQALGSTEVTRYDPLERYMAEIRGIAPLTREEEHQLAVRFKETGDKMAGYKLVVANLRLVVMIAREYQRNVQNILDLVQEGNIGLLEAVQQFDPYRGIRFPSYAVYWIRAYMLRFIINNIRLVKIGTTQAQRKLFFNLNKERERLEAEGFVPEARLLADRLNVKESEVLEMEQRLALPDLSMDMPSAYVEDGFDLHGILPGSTATAEEKVSHKQFSQLLRESIEEFKTQIDDKEKAIIDRRLFTEDPQTLQEIADDFGLSRERIRQLEARLKERLKEYLKEKLDIDAIEDVSLDFS